MRTRDLKRVTVDTTVQPKAITFPTDAKLLHQRPRHHSGGQPLSMMMRFLRAGQETLLAKPPEAGIPGKQSS